MPRSFRIETGTGMYDPLRDLRSGLYALLLTDATIFTVRKNGAERYSEVMNMRAEIHRAVREDLGL